MREIVFDTETTGRDPDMGDRIVEIGCVELMNLLPTGRTFHRYVNPERQVPDEVVKVHGLTSQFLRGHPVFRDVIDDLLAFFQDSPIIAHNADFDRKFLNAELHWLGRPPEPADRFIDTLPMARARFPGASVSLDALSRRFQLDRLGFDLAKRAGAGGHGALLDAKMLAEVYLQLKGGRERELAFSDAGLVGAETHQAGSALAFTPRRPRPTPLAPRLTAEEEAAHAAFVAELGEKALWLKLSA